MGAACTVQEAGHVTASEHGDGLGETADIIRGWEAASEIAGRSVASVRKLVDGGRLRAEKSADGVYVFERADLLALPRVVRAPEPEAVPYAPPSGTPVESTAPPLPTALALTHVAANAPRPSSLDGELAAAMFGEFAAGRAAVEVVVSLKQPPEVVESAYEAWRRMKAMDTTSSEARGRIDQFEEALQGFRRALDALTAVVDAQAPTITEASTGVWAQRQDIDGLLRRTAGLERHARFDGHADLRGLRQRLGAVEQALRALPATPLAIGVPCSACGHQLAVAASCTGCGAGRTALG
jgi:hypothetical protein